MPRRQVIQEHCAPKALIKYLDPQLPTDAFCVSGISILFQSSDASLRRLLLSHWSPFAIPISQVKRIRAVIQFSSGSKRALPRLKKLHSFVNEHFLFLSDGKRYLLTGYLYNHPWQFHCGALPDWDANFIYYYILEPVILDLLKKLGVLVWHSAAVTKDGFAMLLPGISGSGKSTTALNLLSLGYRFLADDLVLLRRRRGMSLEASGYESGLYLTDKSLQLLPEWKKFKRGRRYKKGQRWKYRIDLESFRPPESSKPPLVKYVIFPQVTGGRKTRLEKLTPTQAMIECLQQVPKELPAAILGPSVLQSQFEIYSDLVRSAHCYRLRLGADQDHARAVLSGLGSRQS
jgi:hypothetical protein